MASAKSSGAKKTKTAQARSSKAKAGGKKKAAKATPKKRKVNLSPREIEVFRLTSLGCSVPEIAAILRIAPSTADNQKASLMAKLGTNKSALLARLAIKMGVSPMNDKLTPAEKRRSGRKRDGWN